MNYKQRAMEWYTRALSEKDEFVRFILLYISFEVSIKERFNKIRDIKKDNKIRNIVLRSIPSEQLSKLKEKLESKPLINMNPDGDQRWSGKLNSIDDFDGIIEFIIRARNNLFHGNKGLDIQRDSFIVRWGSALLEPLVGAVLNEQTLHI